MVGIKKLLAVAAVVCTVVASDGHEPACTGTAVTITITSLVTDCAMPGLPAPTNPGPSYAPPPASSGATPPGPSSQAPPPAPPASSAESSAPLSSGVLPGSSTLIIPSSSAAQSQTESPSGSGSQTTPAPSSTAAGQKPSSSAPATVSTAGATIATPLVGIGSLVAAMAVFVWTSSTHLTSSCGRSP